MTKARAYLLTWVAGCLMLLAASFAVNFVFAKLGEPQALWLMRDVLGVL